jgi:hypothetical protein
VSDYPPEYDEQPPPGDELAPESEQLTRSWDMLCMISGNEQLDNAVGVLMDAVLAGDISKMVASLPYIKAAVADMSVPDETKDEAMAGFECAVNDFLLAMAVGKC